MLYLKSFIIFFLIGTFVYQEIKINELSDQVNIVYTQQLLKERRNKLEESDFIRTAKNSMIILRCEDTTSPSKAWIASAVKPHPNYIVTVFHNISKESNKIKRTYPISCKLTQENVKMGEFTIKSEKDAQSFQVGLRDIALIPVKFTKEGMKMPILNPEKIKVSAGDVVALLSSPAKFHLDATVGFGVVLSNSVKYSLQESYKEFWKDAVSSDVFATGGSSGGGIVHLENEGRFIGLHVGNNNKSGIHLALYHLLFDDEFFEVFNKL